MSFSWSVFVCLFCFIFIPFSFIIVLSLSLSLGTAWLLLTWETCVLEKKDGLPVRHDWRRCCTKLENSRSRVRNKLSRDRRLNFYCHLVALWGIYSSKCHKSRDVGYFSYVRQIVVRDVTDFDDATVLKFWMKDLKEERKIYVCIIYCFRRELLKNDL